MESEKKALYGSNTAATALAMQFLIWKSLPHIINLSGWLMGKTDIRGTLLEYIEGAVIYILSCALPTVIFFLLRGKKPRKYLRTKTELQLFPAFSLIFTAVLTLLFVVAFNAAPSNITPPLTYEMPKETANLIALFLVRVIILPVSVEVFFRGVILNEFLPFGRVCAISISAFSCAALSSSLSEFIYIFTLGAVCALFVYATDSLWTGVFMHVVSNLTLFLSSFVISRGIDRKYAGGLVTLISFSAVLGVISVIALSKRFRKNKITPTRYEKNNTPLAKGIFTPCAVAYYLLIILYY